MASLPRLSRRSAVGVSGNANALTASALSAAGISSREMDALRASGFRVAHEDTDKLRRLIQPWQTRAFSYYDQLGEIKYASQFYARMLSPLRLYAAKKDENGDWNETDDPDAKAALERVQDPGGGREDLLSSYGRLMFLTGECYLLVTLNRETGEEQWEVLSTDELRIQSGIYVRYKAPSLVAEQLHEPADDDFEPIDDETAIAYRLWRRHPRWSALADSTMMGVLDLCEELLILTRTVRARAKSRLAGSGILAISEDFSYGPAEAVGDEDPHADPFLADLTAAMMLPIANEGTASSVVPLIIRGTTDAVQKGIRHIPLVDPLQLYPETGLRTECIDRIAIGLDLPPEILKGLGETSNHWTAWQIDEQTWKAHGQPIANQLVNDLSSAYFRPQLRDDGKTDWQSYAIRYDATAIINHPDRSKDAKDLYDRNALSKEALRDATGFSEEDAPSEAERAERIGIQTRDSSLAWYGIPSPRGGAVEPEPGEIVDASSSAPGGPSSGAEVEKSPPLPQGEEPVAVVGSTRDVLVSRISGACDLALFRAREAAGNKVRSLAKRDDEMTELIIGLPARDVCWTLGPDRVRSLGVSEASLVSAGTALILDAVALWVSDTQRATLIAEQVERHAARTLYEERPFALPPQFSSYVSGVLVSGK